MEREQQEEMQVRAWAIMVMQGGGTPGPLTVVVVPILRVCERCMVQLGEPKGKCTRHASGGGNCSDGKQDRGEQETSAETHGQAEDGDGGGAEGRTGDADPDAGTGGREREWMEIRRAHLAITRRAADRDEERLELEQVRTSLGQQWMEDLWRMGTLMWTPFVYSAKGKEKEVETGAEAEAEEKGDKADNKDEDVQGEEE
ncbi:hypothetical protein SCLCIDRAFT_24917 [Scleroderma citrinum Foug A]|uniref:Uncharacterized protein n=1 Tax=Scleroderma citrinum Foug A TaxID=1036808 RepID=A0A0C3ACK3_9AGAM|nr:hypothetical protein SCLCIDRAFT_24917 [Scleroderma citrinum Foug A]